MKKLLFVLLLSTLIGCTTEYEYKIVSFQREGAKYFEDQLNELSNEGYEYVGQITPNGVNGGYVAFRRKK